MSHGKGPEHVSHKFHLENVDGTVQGRINYSGTSKNLLMQIFGFDQLTVKSTASATTSTSTDYIDVHFLVDVSSSMGIGATAKDEGLLQSATGCSLACHYQSSNYGLARSSGATLRIDVVRDAIVKFMENVEKARKNDEQV